MRSEQAAVSGTACSTGTANHEMILLFIFMHLAQRLQWVLEGLVPAARQGTACSAARADALTWALPASRPCSAAGSSSSRRPEQRRSSSCSTRALATHAQPISIGSLRCHHAASTLQRLSATSSIIKLCLQVDSLSVRGASVYCSNVARACTLRSDKTSGSAKS